MASCANIEGGETHQYSESLGSTLTVGSRQDLAKGGIICFTFESEFSIFMGSACFVNVPVFGGFYVIIALLLLMFGIMV